MSYNVAPADFKADSNCHDLVVNASCSIVITFTPSHSDGQTEGSITVNASPADSARTPKVVTLNGKAMQHCQTFGFGWNWTGWPVFVIVGLYLIALVLVRWHMIAKPARAQLVAEIKSIWSWVEAETSLQQPQPQGRIEQIKQLLDSAALPLISRRFRVTTEELIPLPAYTRAFNMIFWTRGAELAGWSYAHQAAQQMIALLPDSRVRAWMETAEAELRKFKTDDSDLRANRLHAALQPGAPLDLEALRSLLIESMRLIDTHQETRLYQLFVWHNKMLWLVGSALLFIVAIGITFQNAVLMLVGAVGGLLSRLMQNLKASKDANDYGASWGALFLSPLTGALAAWGGILLMILAARLQLLGAALNFDWCNPYQPVTLAIGLLFGFTERLFDDIATQVEPKLLPTKPAAPTPPAPTPPAPAPPAPVPPAAPAPPAGRTT